MTAILIATTIALATIPTALAATYPTGKRLRTLIYRTDPCLAAIIDRENPPWDVTLSYGWHHDVNDSYGLGQANPGTKMTPFGRDWRTNPWTQLRWMRSYAQARYGSACAALAFWLRHKAY